jgi:hypothetical protein
MNENLTVNANLIPFQIVASDEICRINADGTTTYHWDRIEAAAQRWEPGCVDIAACLSKLLLPLRGRSEWRPLSEQERHRLWRKLGEGEGIAEYAEAIEDALKEKNNG